MSRVEIKTKGKNPAYRFPFEGWVEVRLPENVPFADHEKQLLAINELLAHKRLMGRDHHPDQPGEKFYGAALIKTADNRYFLHSNQHVHNAPTSRNCAEALSITAACDIEGADKMQITDLWFMGGNGDLSAGLKLLPKEKGVRYAPCGSCLDVIWNNRHHRVPGDAEPETRIHMFPANDGDLKANGWFKLLADDGRPTAKLAPNQVMTRKISQLLPHVTYSLYDPNGKHKELIMAGWDMLQDKGAGKALGNALQSDALLHLNGLKDAPAEERVKAINALMVDTMKQMADRSSVPLKSARVVVVRLDNGEFYLGQSLDNGKASSMQCAEFDAIDHALASYPTDRCVTDIFIMAVDFNKTSGVRETWQAHPDADIEVQMPDGATRRRISSVSPNNGKEFTDMFGKLVNHKTGANVHIMLPNDKEHFHPLQHVITLPLAELLPIRYLSPKMAAEQAAMAEGVPI